MTESEYTDAHRLKRFNYRLMRNPMFVALVGPIAVFAIKQRFKGSLCDALPRGIRFWNVHATTIVAAILIATGCTWLGPRLFLTIWGLSFWVAAAAGIFLFYMQHNFEEVYYATTRESYCFDRAGINGSSYFDAPSWLHWFTGNIGYHHIHHLDPKIPNYRLGACHRALFDPNTVKYLSLPESFATLRLKLLVPEENRMITWSEYKQRRLQAAD